MSHGSAAAGWRHRPPIIPSITQQHPSPPGIVRDPVPRGYIWEAHGIALSPGGGPWPWLGVLRAVPAASAMRTAQLPLRGFGRYARPPAEGPAAAAAAACARADSAGGAEGSVACCGLARRPRLGIPRQLWRSRRRCTVLRPEARSSAWPRGEQHNNNTRGSAAARERLLWQRGSDQFSHRSIYAIDRQPGPCRCWEYNKESVDEACRRLQLHRDLHTARDHQLPVCVVGRVVRITRAWYVFASRRSRPSGAPRATARACRAWVCPKHMIETDDSGTSDIWKHIWKQVGQTSDLISKHQLGCTCTVTCAPRRASLLF